MPRVMAVMPRVLAFIPRVRCTGRNALKNVATLKAKVALPLFFPISRPAHVETTLQARVLFLGRSHVAGEKSNKQIEV